ncbi:MAG TPA: LytR C-terminal domain-containing protein [Patescibacteria group bacterium]|nr:LytR C-terminal domain-containing protein [Patescibacteria group bacterium]
MKSRSAHGESNSLKTFFLYFGIVVFLIVISLGVKSYFLLQQSRFDREHEFILALVTDNRVEELLVFHPGDRTVTEVSLEGSSVRLPALGSVVGVLPDAYVTSSQDLASLDAKQMLREIAWKFPSVDTNLTIFDAFGLMVTAQRATVNAQDREVITVSKETEAVDQQLNNLFVDDTIFAENISIQIINASDQPGLGRRLERILEHLGANIVAISSARQEEEISTIQYYGKISYTLKKFKKLLNFPIKQIEKKTIADIVIIIGNDAK